MGYGQIDFSSPYLPQQRRQLSPVKPQRGRKIARDKRPRRRLSRKLITRSGRLSSVRFPSQILRNFCARARAGSNFFFPPNKETARNEGTRGNISPTPPSRASVPLIVCTIGCRNGMRERRKRFERAVSTRNVSGESRNVSMRRSVR